jgi:hypothetical protein
VFIIIALIGLYLFFQWKKKSNAKTDTNIPQNSASTLSNITPVRQDIITNQNLTDNNAPIVNSSSTSDNPVTRENAQPISIVEHLSDVTVAISPGVIIPPVLTPSPSTSVMIPNTPLASSTNNLTISQIPDVVMTIDGREVESFSPNTPQQYRKDTLNAALVSNPSLKTLIPAEILSLLAA